MKRKITCYIIDDEPLAQEILEEYIAKVPFLELRGTFMSPLEATAQLDHDKPELLFLDINMPDLDGLSFIQMLNPRPNIILTTAYDQYALKAFELVVKDYLVKPFSFERFYQGVLRLYQEASQQPPLVNNERAMVPRSEQDYIFLKVSHRFQKVSFREILFIEGMRDYLRIHTTREKIMALLNFAQLEELLPMSDFARVHRSYMVAIDKIDHIERNRIQIGDEIIPISDTYVSDFYKKLRGLP